MERSKKRRRKRRRRSRRRRKYKFSRSFCKCITIGKTFWNSCTVPKVMLNRPWSNQARFLIFYVKKDSPWNISWQIHLEPLGIKLVVVCNCTTCFTLLSQTIAYFFLFIFVFCLPEPRRKGYSASASLLFEVNSHKKKVSHSILYP